MPLGDRLGIRDSIRGILVESSRELLRAVLLQPGVPGIPYDGQQPGATVTSPKSVKEPECPQTGLLDHILRIRRIANKPTSQIVGSPDVRHDDFREPAGFVGFSHLHTLPDSPSLYTNCRSTLNIPIGKKKEGNNSQAGTVYPVYGL